MGGGVALLDFDGDGWLDIYAVQGGPFPRRRTRPPFGDRLFRNRGDGRFDDATDASGLARLPGGYGYGVAVGDFDNDGRPDLFVTRWRSYALYHNLGDGRFEDVTARAGLGGDRDWPTSAAWADLDNDGDLDLYVCHYLKWDEAQPDALRLSAHRPGTTYCDPRRFPSLPDHVFRNDGGRFVDVTEQAGIVDREGRGLGVVAADLDDDGKIDLFVANDTTANYFFRNRGGFRFTEEGLESGLAASATAATWRGWAWLAATSTATAGSTWPSPTSWTNRPRSITIMAGVFQRPAPSAGLAAPTRFVLGFGLAALDANNDGRLDLAQANGHVDDYRPSVPYAMPAQLFLSDGAGSSSTSRTGRAPWQVPRLGRGLAVGDLDNDGRTDVVIVAQDAPLALLHNRAAFQTTPSRSRSRGPPRIATPWSAGGRDRLGEDAGGGAVGRRKLSLGERSPSSLRLGTGREAWIGRGHVALGPPRLLPGPRGGRRVSPARRGPCSQAPPRFAPPAGER